MLPTTTSTADVWAPRFDFPSRLYGTNNADYELYEEDDDFVLNVDMPGFDREDIQVSWDEARLFIWAEHEDDERGRRKSFRRTFRPPKEIEPQEITAHYRNGVLEVRLPILDARIRGTEIEVRG